MIIRKLSKINRSFRGLFAIFTATLLLTINLSSLVAQTPPTTTDETQVSNFFELSCSVEERDGAKLDNQASYTYGSQTKTLRGVSNLISSQLVLERTNIEIIALGITGEEGEAIEEEIDGNEFVGKQLTYGFKISNQGNTSADLTIPDITTIQDSVLVGKADVVRVAYLFAQGQENTDHTEEASLLEEVVTATPVTLEPENFIELFITIEVPRSFANNDSISLAVGIRGKCGGSSAQLGTTLIVPLTDPFGRVTGCEGELLPNYQGFSVGIYEPDGSPTGGIAGLVPLTVTDDNPNNNIPEGIEPNIENSNPFFLTNADEGTYSFLFDESRGQLDLGREYILLVNPPSGSVYGERRVRLTIGTKEGDVVNYTAQSLDGQSLTVIDSQGNPLSDGETQIQGTFVVVRDAESEGLNLVVFNLDLGICEAQELRLDKSADRIATEPGDIVLYRLNTRNLLLSNDSGNSRNLAQIEITDQLPVGINLIKESVKGQLGEELVPITVTSSDRTITFSPEDPSFELGEGKTLSIIYAARVTPDAVRGSGRNSAIVNGTVNGRSVREGPATHRLEIRSGILTDYGTIIGRVFVDKNFDGEQQPGEPGVPNAVIFLQNGNRITTDADGLFSVINVLPGSYTGVLDPLSIPEYELAPNLRFSERNSKSRLVRVSPGSMVRMNFAVTPKAQEVGNE